MDVQEMYSCEQRQGHVVRSLLRIEIEVADDRKRYDVTEGRVLVVR